MDKRVWEADEWVTVSLEGPRYGSGGVVLADTVQVNMLRKVFRLPPMGPPQLIDGKGLLARAAERRPENFHDLDPQAQWDVDKRLGILDWDGDPKK